MSVFRSIVDKSALPENRTIPGQGIQPPSVTGNTAAPLGEPLPDLKSIPRNQPFQPGQQNRQPLDLSNREPEFVELPDANEKLNPEALRLPPPGFDPGALSPARRAEYDADPQAYLRKYFDN